MSTHFPSSEDVFLPDKTREDTIQSQNALAIIKINKQLTSSSLSSLDEEPNHEEIRK